MILALEDDALLHVYNSAQDACKAVEPLDAPEVFRAIFDEHAQPYRIEWLTPNSHGRLLGLIPWSVNGTYRLAPHGSPDPDGLIRAIRMSRGVTPTNLGSMVRDLEARTSAGRSVLP